MAGIMVFIKMAVIALFVIAGAFFVQPDNWTPFAPNGASGIFAGAFMIFFAYIGFDALATSAEECKNPQKDLPIGIIGSLLVTTVVYVLVALVLTGMQDTSVRVSEDFLNAPMAFCMAMTGKSWATYASYFISIGSLAGLTSVLLVLEMAATRILFAMSRDNFISPKFQLLNKIACPCTCNSNITNCIFKHQYPTYHPRHKFTKRSISISVGTSCNRNHCRNF